MTRSEALMLISPRLYDLLGMMYSRHRRWMPNIGYPRMAAGFATGGSVSYESMEEWESEQDTEAVWVLESAYSALSKSEQVMIEQLMGRIPWVFVARPGVLESAIQKLAKKMREIGVE